MTLFFLWSAARPERTPYGITFFWITFMSAVCGRLLGLLRKGFSGPSQPVVAAVGILMAVLALIIRRSQSQPASGAR